MGISGGCTSSATALGVCASSASDSGWQPGPLGGIPVRFYESPCLGRAAQILQCREAELMQREISIPTATSLRCDIFAVTGSCGEQSGIGGLKCQHHGCAFLV